MTEKNITITKDTNQSLALAQAAHAWERVVSQDFPQFSYEHALTALKLYMESSEDEKKTSMEKNLYLQAHVLDSLFKTMTARALEAPETHVTEMYLRIALRSQSRYVRTAGAIASLHAVPNPTVAIQINNQASGTEKNSERTIIKEGAHAKP